MQKWQSQHFNIIIEFLDKILTKKDFIIIFLDFFNSLKICRLFKALYNL